MRKLHQINLNLLIALDALLTHQSVSKAAAACCVTQSAMSVSLRQLRDVFHDELLFRSSGNRMCLSSKAQALTNIVKNSLGSLQEVFATAEPFDPLHAEREVYIAMPEYAITLLLKPLLSALQQRAPNIKLRIQTIQKVDDLERFLLRHIDLAMAFDGNVKNSLEVVDILDDELYFVARRDHPVWQQQSPHTLESLAAWPQIVWSHAKHYRDTYSGQWYFNHGIKNNVELVLPSGDHILRVIDESDAVSLVVKRYAHYFQHIFDFKMAKVNVTKDYPKISLKLFWHSISSTDPCLAWLRQLIIEVANSLNHFTPLAKHRCA